MRLLTPRTLARLAAIALALPLLTCHQAILTATPETDMTLTVNPEFIPAHGGVAIVSAFLIETNTGTPVPDGTVVQFFSTLGRIEEQGKTNDGVARVKLVSDSRSGEATVTARSGAVLADEPVSVKIGNENVRGIILRAQPSRIINSNSTHVIATVLGESGNPVPNVAVYFKVVDHPATEFFDSSGRPVFTNNNGEAEDVLRTRREFQDEAVVRAEVVGPAGIIFQNLTIPIL
jgi:hypothetical protein